MLDTSGVDEAEAVQIEEPAVREDVETIVVFKSSFSLLYIFLGGRRG